ncbi:hypothetical protein HispidOSU_018975 [Sigmodon hispidus]
MRACDQRQPSREHALAKQRFPRSGAGARLKRWGLQRLVYGKGVGVWSPDGCSWKSPSDPVTYGPELPVRDFQA